MDVYPHMQICMRCCYSAHTHAHAAQSDGTVPSQEPLIPLV